MSAEKTVHVQAVHYVRGWKLRIEFSDGVVTEADFGPFLRAATHPGIRRDLGPRRLKKFAISDGVVR